MRLFGGTRTRAECDELLAQQVLVHGPAVAEVDILDGKVFRTLDPKK